MGPILHTTPNFGLPPGALITSTTLSGPQVWCSCPCSLCAPCLPDPLARPQASLHKALLEVASEGLTLIALDLAVLDSLALQVVIYLCGVDGRRPLLVLG